MLDYDDKNMEAPQRSVRLEGGPLDGTTITVPSGRREYRHAFLRAFTSRSAPRERFCCAVYVPHPSHPEEIWVPDARLSSEGTMEMEG